MNWSFPVLTGIHMLRSLRVCCYRPKALKHTYGGEPEKLKLTFQY